MENISVKTVNTILPKKENEIRRSKRTRNSTVCYDEEKIVISNVLGNKRRCLDSISGISTPGIYKIRVGSSYQASQIPNYFGAFNEGDMKDDINYPDRDEIFWHPSSSNNCDEESMREFFVVAKKHQRLQIEEALKVIMLSGYSVISALERLEEFQSIRPIVLWTEKENRIFDEIISRNSRQFRRVVKALANNKTIADIIEHYYCVKKMSILASAQKILSNRTKYASSSELLQIIPRSKCFNCVHSAYQTRAGKLMRRRYDVCLACQFYIRLTCHHRPFTIPLINEEKNNSSQPRVLATVNGVPLMKQLIKVQLPALRMKNMNIVKSKQENKSVRNMQSKLHRVNHTTESTNDEAFKCLKAIQKHDSDWEAAQMNKRTIVDVLQFYAEYNSQYESNTIISLPNNNSKSSNNIQAVDQ